MGSDAIYGCIGCIIGLSMIAFRFFTFYSSVLAYSLLYDGASGEDDTDLFDDVTIGNFIDDCIIPIENKLNIIKPHVLELVVLMWMPIVACVLSCCCGCCALVPDIQDQIVLLTSCIVTIELVATIAGIFHLSAYLFSLKTVLTDNGLSDCVKYRTWEGTMFFTEIAFGFAIGFLVIGCCCAVCIWYTVNNEDTYDYSQPTHQQSRESKPVTIGMQVQKKSNPSPLRKQSLSENTKKIYGTVFSAALIEALGFKLATSNNKNDILYALRNTYCSGATALRDAVGNGVRMMLELKEILDKHSVIGHKFIHIVLTDGEDNSSNVALEELAAIFMLMGIAFGDHFGKTFFVGIDLKDKAQREFQAIAQLAGKAAETFNCNDFSMEDVFERIRINIGLQKRVGIITDGENALFMEQDRVVLSAEREKFLVLFTLDKSGSMKGPRWTKLQQAISSFLNELDGGDIVGVVLFNDKVQRLAV